MDAVLDSLYRPLSSLLEQEGLMELSVVGDGKIGFESVKDGYIYKEMPEFGTSYWKLLCHALANYNGLKFNPPDHCFLSLALPGGHRFQAKMGAGVASGVAISIRLFRDVTLPLESFGLNEAQVTLIKQKVQKGTNCLVSGGTSSGKTTFLRQLLKNIPLDKRILTIEDTRELYFPDRWNVEHHVVSRTGTKEEKMMSWADNIDHIMRSRPDVLVLGEVSTSNAYPVVRLLNSGHAGFFTTIHANSATLALGKTIPQNVRLGGQAAEGVEEVLGSTVDMVIQLEKVGNKRKVIEILLPQESSQRKSKTIIKNTAMSK